MKKSNKITLKKYRLDYLEMAVNAIASETDWARSCLKDEKENLEQATSEPFDNDDKSAVYEHECRVRRYQEQVQTYEDKISEGEKLIAELEKMV